MEKQSKFKEFFRVVKFTLISISAGIIQIGLFALLNEVFAWNYWVAYLISLLASILWNFTINRKVTFKSANNVKIAMLLVLLFYAVFTPVSTILGELAENNGVNDYIVLAVTMISNFVLEFLYTRYIVYRNSCDTAEKNAEDTKKTKKKPLFFRFLVFVARKCYRKYQIISFQNLPEEPCVIVANHVQLHGPFATQFYMGFNKRIWCTYQMMNKKEFPKYAYEDFFAHKGKTFAWFYKAISHILAPLACYIFKHADTIEVYHDQRVLGTFKKSVEALEDGNNVIIFPEFGEKHNEIINNFQDKYIDLAKLYFKKHGKELKFIPMYIAPTLKTMVMGVPVTFDSSASIEDERKRINGYLMSEITSLAKALPKHKVVPYKCKSKKEYPDSK